MPPRKPSSERRVGRNYSLQPENIRWLDDLAAESDATASRVLNRLLTDLRLAYEAEPKKARGKRKE